MDASAVFRFTSGEERAGVAIVFTIDRGSIAHAFDTPIRECAGIAVVARFPFFCSFKDATKSRSTEIRSTGVSVVTDEARTSTARSILLAFGLHRACVSVFAIIAIQGLDKTASIQASV